MHTDTCTITYIYIDCVHISYIITYTTYIHTHTNAHTLIHTYSLAHSTLHIRTYHMVIYYYRMDLLISGMVSQIKRY